MTSEIRQLIDETAESIVQDTDLMILKRSKRNTVEKHLEQFFNKVVTLDDKKATPAPTA